jgi:hypothetical protein
MSKTLKILLIVLGVIVVIAGIVMMGGKQEPATGLTSSSGANPTLPAAANANQVAVVEAQDRTARLLAILNQVTSLELDSSFLDSAAFMALNDLSTALPVDPNPGRPNPFLSIGTNADATVLNQ